MKLLVDAHIFDYDVHSGGLFTYLRGLYGAMTSFADDIEFYFGAVDTDALRKVFGSRDNVHYVKYGTRNKYVRLGREFPRIVRRYGIDAAHYQYVSPLSKCCREIVTMHDILPVDFPGMFPASFRLPRKVMFRRSARRADLLLTVSDYSRQRIAHNFGIDAGRILVTPNAVPPVAAAVPDEACRSMVSRFGVAGEYILYLSHIEPRKNHIGLLRAYCDLRLWERGLDLVFVGGMSIPVKELDDCLAGLPAGVREHVRITGPVSDEEVEAFFRCASFFVYPSLAEGFGIPPLEAALYGVPTLCSDRTAMADFAFFGPRHFNPEDEAGFRSALLHLVDSPDPVLTARIRSEVADRFAWDRIARDFYAGIKQMEGFRDGYV